MEQISSGSIVGIGQAACQPPALMEALAARAEAGLIDDVKVYYWDLGIFGQQKRLKPLRDKGLTSIYDFP